MLEREIHSIIRNLHSKNIADYVDNQTIAILLLFSFYMLVGLYSPCTRNIADAISRDCTEGYKTIL